MWSAPVYIALLRGINVSGKVVRMEELRASFEALGFGRVRSYVQSGNVVFEAGKAAPKSLSKIIEKKIMNDFGFSVPLVLRTSDEMKEIVRSNPFLREKGIDITRLHVTFLSALPEEAALRKLDGLDAGIDQFRIEAREIYLHCPNGYGRTRLSNNAFEKLLSIKATTRNWKTVNTLAEMSSE